jgi:predicted SprT family Zn-dependent metalloprotease
MNTVPYVSLEAAQVKSKKVFDDAMSRWNKFANDNITLHQRKAMNVMLNNVVISWRKVGFNAAGRASVIRNIGELTMNINYLYSKDANEFIDKTLRHELAHIITYAYNKTMKHDKLFKTVAKIIGDDGNRCHDYATPENKPARVRKTYERKPFTCPKCGRVHNLTPLMQKRCAAGGYICKCGLQTNKFVTI